MKVYPTNVLESLAGELPAETLMLAALLENQIESLALLWCWGLWSVSPSELPDRLRTDDGGKMHWSQSLGIVEWQLWGGATDALLAALERETPIRIDRGRIASLAARRGRELRGRGGMGRRRGR